MREFLIYIIFDNLKFFDDALTIAGSLITWDDLTLSNIIIGHHIINQWLFICVENE